MDKVEQVTLKLATVEDEHLLKEYVLEDDQYTIRPLEAMKNSLTEKDAFPVLIMAAAELVGFFILKVGTDMAKYSSDSDIVVLESYSIDERYQKKGYGKLSMEVLPGFISEHFPGVQRIILAVDIDNVSGQLLYLKSGFTIAKERYKTEKGYKFIFSKKI